MLKDLWFKRTTDNNIAPYDCDMYYNIGSITRSCLAALRGSLELDLSATAEDVFDRRSDLEGQTSNIQRLTYEEWIRALWQNLPDCKKEEKNRHINGTIVVHHGMYVGDKNDEKNPPYMVFKDFEHFERTVRHAVIPTNQHSIGHLVLQTAWEGENILSVDGTWKQSEIQKALQLDSYYATMVRGACIKVPLTPDIWCPHDEMQHTGEDTALFFTVMWQGLEQVAKQWHSNILSWTTRLGGASSNNNAASDGLESILQSSEVTNTTRRVKDIKRVMKEIWEVMGGMNCCYSLLTINQI